MRNDIIRIKAVQAKPGMTLCFSDPRFDVYIDDMRFTRDGDVHLYVGVGGTGLEVYQANDIIWIQR